MLIKKSLEKDLLRSCYFVHIPKTAGTTMIKYLKSAGNFELRKINHDLRSSEFKYFHEYTDRQNFFSFCFVRNPIDRALSAFYFLSEGGLNEEDKIDADRYVSRYNGDFNEFVRNEFPKGEIFSQIHFKPQYEWIIDENRLLCVDYIAKFEDLDTELNKLSNLLGFRLKENFEINVTRRPSVQLEDDVLALIQSHYRNDFEYFKYS